MVLCGISLASSISAPVDKRKAADFNERGRRSRAAATSDHNIWYQPARVHGGYDPVKIVIQTAQSVAARPECHVFRDSRAGETPTRTPVSRSGSGAALALEGTRCADGL
jgi:hypothetical protein